MRYRVAETCTSIIINGTLLGKGTITTPTLSIMSAETIGLYFLKISGEISERNQREFEQTVQFVFNQLSPSCLQHNLTLDVHTPHLYHLYSLWKSERSLANFRGSHEFELIKGAFQTLGSYKDTISGRAVESQVFEINH